MFFLQSALNAERVKELKLFCKNLSIRFKNLELLDLAFHHRSYSNENGAGSVENNERLEFLGDSVLGMATAAYLYDKIKTKAEGDLAKVKGVVVSEKSLAPIARNIGIDKMLVLGKGEEMSGGRNKDAILADCVEAVIGAYYLDSGYENVQQFILKLMIPEIEKVLQNKSDKDYKTLLQEYFQKRYKTCPIYELVKRTGPDHDQTFWVTVKLNDKTFGPECGRNKKTAEQNVAKKAYEELVK